MSIYLKPIINKLTPESRNTLDSAINYAISRSHHEVDCLHLLWKLLQEHKYIAEVLYEQSLFNPRGFLMLLKVNLSVSIQYHNPHLYFLSRCRLYWRKHGYMPVLNGKSII